ncbi:hypothetical protein HPP92_006180 [Vanilla planifolia]|uniref:Uncharacterized protein n=1 Tax=Vanilla planifolia TaxID=51239 RepID=A0A835RN38_VANPL|nr:hypothetical protein HPP92_006180 [Vanilla planifolia]
MKESRWKTSWLKGRMKKIDTKHSERNPWFLVPSDRTVRSIRKGILDLQKFPKGAQELRVGNQWIWQCNNVLREEWRSLRKWIDYLRDSELIPVDCYRIFQKQVMLTSGELAAWKAHLVVQSRCSNPAPAFIGLIVQAGTSFIYSRGGTNGTASKECTLPTLTLIELLEDFEISEHKDANRA